MWTSGRKTIWCGQWFPPKEKDLTGLGNFADSLTNRMAIGICLSWAFRKDLVSLWLHLKSSNLTLICGKPTIWTLRGDGFLSLNQSKHGSGADDHLVIACHLVFADAFVVCSGLDRSITTLARWMACLNEAWGQASLDWLALGFFVSSDLVLVASLSSQTGRRGGRGEDFLFDESRYRYLGKCVWCVHSFDDNVTMPKRQTSVMLALLAEHPNIP